MRGQHHVLAHREHAGAAAAGDRPGRAQRAVGVLLVLALHADPAVGVPEHEHDRAHDVDVLDRRVPGDRPAGAVDQLFGDSAPAARRRRRTRRPASTAAAACTPGRTTTHELPRLRVARAARAASPRQDPRQHVVRDAAGPRRPGWRAGRRWRRKSRGSPGRAGRSGHDGADPVRGRGRGRRGAATLSAARRRRPTLVAVASSSVGRAGEGAVGVRVVGREHDRLGVLGEHHGEARARPPRPTRSTGGGSSRTASCVEPAPVEAEQSPRCSSRRCTYDIAHIAPDSRNATRRPGWRSRMPYATNVVSVDHLLGHEVRGVQRREVVVEAAAQLVVRDERR